MKLEPPLSNLVARCQTICVAECCGIDAYDFSPIQIASYLTMVRGSTDASEIRVIRGQIEALRANYGTGAASGHGATFDDLNQGFTAEQIDGLAHELLTNLDVALRLIQQSEEMRYKNLEPVTTDGTSEVTKRSQSVR
jgi:hypothetical protein